MLIQKEFNMILSAFRQNNMDGYEEWFQENINCRFMDEKDHKWKRGIRLKSVSKYHAMIVVEGYNGLVFRIPLKNCNILEL